MLRVSKVIRFLSHPVLTGFTTGAACFIGFSQLRLCFGIKVGFVGLTVRVRVRPSITLIQLQPLLTRTHTP